MKWMSLGCTWWCWAAACESRQINMDEMAPCRQRPAIDKTSTAMDNCKVFDEVDVARLRLNLRLGSLGDCPLFKRSCTVEENVKLPGSGASIGTQGLARLRKIKPPWRQGWYGTLPAERSL
ncbi:hypothetical protein QBC37DRAFT_432279 [Rhypophila decipiens]|uniref:Secreted protein n=1 Tax=Rhypophila decipiens TaxID=261697 RepID=A0AAN6XYV0_9PEZI|nr:hypothetical protein QBC37DRAFT_432279 [Rhypophila decipiens]